uniref:Protein phosphatase 1 regulatory subunit 35 isoform X2 n=1 Tax=Geotrypetes seraphini TaxID=260995 RepID=A0A6P8PFY4_GEOSA|nr:protein phosphatase 1 regulatory subunit 35 isoform X2 [Geotrypetes seraphini]
MKFLSADFPHKKYTPNDYTDEESVPTDNIPQPLALLVDCTKSLSDLDISGTPEKLGGGNTPWGILKKSEEVGSGGKRGNNRQVRFHFSCDLERSEPGIPSSSLPEPLEGEDFRTFSMLLGDAKTVEGALAAPGVSRENKQPGRNKLLTENRMRKKGQQARLNEYVPCSLSSPEYNASLALGQEMLAVAEKGFDARKAVADQLQKSSVTRQCVDGKVAEGMNIPREKQLFQGLVSLQVPTEEILSSAVQEKLLMVKPRPDIKKVKKT